MELKISEIFKSCQGEGPSAGLPSVFVRLSGCNLHPDCCFWCDTKYAQTDKGKTISVGRVVTRVEELSNGCRRVCLTGGEPLHSGIELFDLIDRLKFRGYFIEVFTNGTIQPPNCLSLVDSWVVDIKCPSSGVADKCLVDEWLRTVRSQDTVKFVVADSEDLDYITVALKKFETRAQVALSPCITTDLLDESSQEAREWMQAVWNFCVEHNYQFGLQVHRVVWEGRRGV